MSEKAGGRDGRGAAGDLHAPAQPTAEHGGGLRGRRVVNTRAPHQASRLDDLLRARGAVPVRYPCIDIAAPQDTSALDDALAAAAKGEFDWILLTSENTALALQRRLADLSLPRDALARAGLHVGVVGSATAGAAARLGLAPEATPTRASGAELAAALPDVAGLRVFLPQAMDAVSDIREALLEAGALVTAVTAYRTDVGSGGEDLVALLRAGRVDAAVFASPSAVRGLFARLAPAGLAARDLAHVAIACLGTTTAAAAEEAGLGVAVCPASQTLSALVDNLDTYFLEEA